MATDVSSTPVNGNYAPHQGYGSLDQSQNGYGNINSQPADTSNAATASTTPHSASGTSEVPKDEVGWYFVEQYYTTLSRFPERLHLFYNKRSQFVLGQETDKVPVCVGQRAINERIKELDFQDCKVRVTNVDSQASDSNIVIQVIGEISNKAAPHKKFTQTFVLAGQTNGYFVLNDIFRYIIEEEDEVASEQTQRTNGPAAVKEPSPAAVQEPEQEPESETLTSSDDAAKVEADAQKVDKELEEKVLSEPAAPEDDAAPPAAVNGVSPPAEEQLAHAEEAPVAAVAADTEEASAPSPDIAISTEALKAETPQDPKPTPAMSPVREAAKPATPAAAAPSKPAMPKTWATLAAAAHKVVAPPAAAPQAGNSPAPTQAKAAPVVSPTPTPAAPAAAPTTPAVPTRAESPAPSQQDEWTSVGGDHKKQPKAQANAVAQEGPQRRAYIKNVHEGLDADELRKMMEKYGEVQYFDVSRQKNCAFVDFKTPEAYKAAVEGNPHTLGGERIIVEERRLKPGAYPYVPRGGARGGRGGPNPGQGRGNFQGGGSGGGGGRGNLTPRGGRGGAAGRGRGGAPAA